MGSTRKFAWTKDACTSYSAFTDTSDDPDSAVWVEGTSYFMATCSNSVITLTEYADSACTIDMTSQNWATDEVNFLPQFHLSFFFHTSFF